MKLDDVIQILQAMRAHHGNLPVYLSESFGEVLLTGVRHADSMPERVVLEHRLDGNGRPAATGGPAAEPSVFEKRSPMPISGLIGPA